jgi:hypothetical protein
MPAVLLLDPATSKPVRILRGSAAHLPAYFDAATATPPTAVIYTEDGKPVAPPIYETDDAGRKTAIGDGDPIPTRPMSEIPADLDAIKIDDAGKVNQKTRAEKDADAAERQAKSDAEAARQAREAIIASYVRRLAIAAAKNAGDLPPDDTGE